MILHHPVTGWEVTFFFTGEEETDQRSSKRKKEEQGSKTREEEEREGGKDEEGPMNDVIDTSSNHNWEKGWTVPLDCF